MGTTYEFNSEGRVVKRMHNKDFCKRRPQKENYDSYKLHNIGNYTDAMAEYEKLMLIKRKS